ncbi:hypothetical protein E3N88_37149 [Mikania micrantha]|uniref:NB-ARC domain-containing protein n=1 Tax=Mikania micrantha TaxID=192012 RepID=A0A5N6M5R5_9ASTR|nr:hypothetical protein E3N88_37149 [Mikania micrantha]
MAKLYSIKGEFASVLDCLERKKKEQNHDMDGVRMNNLYSLQNLVTEWQLTMNKSPYSYKQACESISKRLKKMKKEINGEESSSRGDREGSTRHQKPSQEPKQKPDHPVFKINKAEVYRWSSRHPPTKVRGSDHRVLEMEREIVMHNPNAACKMFGVVGAPGIGKTTLCQTIFGRDSVKQRFCPRIWVCLSKKPTDIKDYRKEIVIRILKSLGIDDEVINDADKEPDQKTGTGENLKGELLKKCDGNPLAAKLLAKIAQNAQKRLNLESKTQPQPATTTDAGKSFDPIKQFPPSGVEQLNSGVRDGEEDKSLPSL